MTEAVHTRDTSDLEQADVEQERRSTHTLNIEAGLRQVLSTRTSRAWLWDVLSSAGLHQGTTNLEHPNVTALMGLQLGMRTVALKIVDQAKELDIDGYLLMQREALDTKDLEDRVDTRKANKKPRKRGGKRKARRKPNDSTES